MTDMTKAEREDLQRLIRQREKVLKSAARQRSAELLADFENQMGQQFSFDQDEVWEKATKIAQAALDKANEQIAARCHEIGIPKRFAPELNLYWAGRHENATKQRRDELRKMAETRVEAIERRATTQIEMSCLDAQTKIAVDELTTKAAQQFIEHLPSIAVLMPALSFEAVAGEADPPVAEQLVSSNALRQRRFRARQAALKSNGHEALQPPLHNATDDGSGDATP